MRTWKTMQSMGSKKKKVQIMGDPSSDVQNKEKRSVNFSVGLNHYRELRNIKLYTHQTTI